MGWSERVSKCRIIRIIVKHWCGYELDVNHANSVISGHSFYGLRLLRSWSLSLSVFTMPCEICPCTYPSSYPPLSHLILFMRPLFDSMWKQPGQRVKRCFREQKLFFSPRRRFLNLYAEKGKRTSQLLLKDWTNEGGDASSAWQQ